jgi:hypothetical protein
VVEGETTRELFHDGPSENTDGQNAAFANAPDTGPGFRVQLTNTNRHDDTRLTSVSTAAALPHTALRMYVLASRAVLDAHSASDLIDIRLALALAVRRAFPLEALESSVRARALCFFFC